MGCVAQRLDIVILARQEWEWVKQATLVIYSVRNVITGEHRSMGRTKRQTVALDERNPSALLDPNETNDSKNASSHQCNDCAEFDSHPFWKPNLA
jgi:hypothetical protein